MPDSSSVEHAADNRAAAGSIPAQATTPGDLCKLVQLLVLETRFLRVRVPPGGPILNTCRIAS